MPDAMNCCVQVNMASSDAGVLEHSGGEDGAEYDSSDGAVPHCPHCDFEATSRLALVAHLAECGGDAEGSTPSFKLQRRNFLSLVGGTP